MELKNNSGGYEPHDMNTPYNPYAEDLSVSSDSSTQNYENNFDSNYGSDYSSSYNSDYSSDHSNYRPAPTAKQKARSKAVSIFMIVGIISGIVICFGAGMFAKWLALVGMGITFLSASVPEMYYELHTKKKRKVPFLSIFVLSGLLMFVGGLILKFGSDDLHVAIYNHSELLVGILLLVIGVGIYAGVIFGKVTAAKYCTYPVMAKVADIRVSTDSDGDRTYMPVYEFQFKGETHLIHNSTYSNIGVPKLGETREIFIDPENLDEYYEKKQQRGNSIFLFVLGAFFMGIGGFILKSYTPIPDAEAIYLAETNSINEIFDDVENHNMHNDDQFFDLVWRFANGAGNEANMSHEWTDPSNLSYDAEGIKNSFSQQDDGYSRDSNGREIAMLVMGGYLSADSLENEYDGEILKDELEMMKSDEDGCFDLVLDKEAYYTTLFGEKEVADGRNPADVYPTIWSEHGIKCSSDDISLITVVKYDKKQNITYVEQAGIEIKCSGYYLLIEKLGYGKPFQATKMKAEDDVFAMLKNRSEYKLDGSDVFIYKNNLLVDE